MSRVEVGDEVTTLGESIDIVRKSRGAVDKGLSTVDVFVPKGFVDVGEGTGTGALIGLEGDINEDDNDDNDEDDANGFPGDKTCLGGEDCKDVTLVV